MIAKVLSALSFLKARRLDEYCGLETVDGMAMVTGRAEYVTLVRCQGISRMIARDEYDAKVEGLRIEIQGTLEQPGHGIQAYYVCDPGQTGVAIEGLIQAPRRIAAELGLGLEDIFDERQRLWQTVMRREETYFALWTRRRAFTREETKQANQERADNRKQMEQATKALGRLGETETPSQDIFQPTEIYAVKHKAFVDRILQAFRMQDIVLELVPPRDALRIIREELYRETFGTDWRPSLPGDPVFPRMPEPGEPVKLDHLLWPSLAAQMITTPAMTHGPRAATIGERDFSPVDVTIGPEDARPFSELVPRLADAHIPWRMSTWIEGADATSMMTKEIFSGLLGFEPTAKSIATAFEALKAMKEKTAEIAVRWRTSFATWAPAGDRSALTRRTATLEQRVRSWGNCSVGSVAGDALDGVMGSALGLGFGTPAPAGFPPVSIALRMLPWCRPALAWANGPVIFRTPDGRIAPYDPSGAGRQAVFTLFVAPPGAGKSTLANSINLGLCMSRASQGSTGTKLPLIGKLDIGESAKGLVDLLRDELPAERKHEAAYVRIKFDPGYEVNVFDTQLGCRTPLRLERTFLQNFLSLATTSLEDNERFEGMDQLITLVIEEAYRMLGDEGPNRSAKLYEPNVDPEVDAALERFRIRLDVEPMWWEVVDALCDHKAHRVAERAQRHAVPVLEDLITAVRAPHVRDNYARIAARTGEALPEVFERYIMSLVRSLPALNAPTRLDLSDGRVIVLDLKEVAGQGSPEADRQTSMMYMLGRHILARNFFLHPEYLSDVPPRMRDHHARRFAEMQEATKRLDYDEYHRTKASPAVRAQVVRDILEGRKHNVQIAVTSQSIKHFDDELISFTTDRFVLGAEDDAEASLIVERFNLSPAAAYVVRNRLKGPGPGGAPFLFTGAAYNRTYEQMLVNTLGPIELWALSTTPEDVQLRNRLYARLGQKEARRRLAAVFPRGSAKAEIDQRKDERLKQGEVDEQAEAGVIEEITSELFDGRGLGILLRPANTELPMQAAE